MASRQKLESFLVWYWLLITLVHVQVLFSMAGGLLLYLTVSNMGECNFLTSDTFINEKSLAKCKAGYIILF